MNEPLERALPQAVPGEAVQVVHSAEQVALHFPIAGPGSRVLAYSIDYIAILAMQITAVALLLLSTPLLQQLVEALRPVLEDVQKGKSPDLSSGPILLVVAVVVLLQLLAEWTYFLVCEAVSGGASPGKRALGLRVIGDDGLPLSRRASVVRNLLRAVDMLPGSYLIGLVALVVSVRGQRLGDMAAGTLVVRFDIAAPVLPLADRPARGVAHSFSRAQLARLDALERTLLRQTLRRFDDLGERQGREVLVRSATALCARMQVEPVASGECETFLRALLRAVDAG